MFYDNNIKIRFPPFLILLILYDAAFVKSIVIMAGEFNSII